MRKSNTEYRISSAIVVYSSLESFVDKQRGDLSKIRESIKLSKILLGAAESGVKDSNVIGMESIEKIKLNIFKLEIIERQLLEGLKDLVLTEMKSNNNLEDIELGTVH